MKREEYYKYIDHTLLKAYATWEEIEKLCEEAIKYGTASVCVPPCYIKRIHKKYPDLTICTVVGFPLGYSVIEAKEMETRVALLDGAEEIDMVINISHVKNRDYDLVEEEIRRLKKITDDKILKVIIETCYLTEEEKIMLCRIVTRAGADFIKTSTGFGSDGATLNDIRLFKKHVGEHVKIKAAGGVKSIEDMEAFILAGASRIGSSSAVSMLEKVGR